MILIQDGARIVFLKKMNSKGYERTLFILLFNIICGSINI